MYHITKFKNIKSIMNLGLIPNYANGLGVRLKERKGMLFLTDNIDYIIDNQLGRGNYFNLNYSIIHVDITGLNIIEFKIPSPYINCESNLITLPHEFVSTTIIPPTKLKLLS